MKQLDAGLPLSDYRPPFAPPPLSSESSIAHDSSFSTIKTQPSPIFTSGSFSTAPSSAHFPPSSFNNMEYLRPPEYGSVKARAIEEARKMQALVVETANKQGINPPKYVLLELIGKGSFGRVFKA